MDLRRLRLGEWVLALSGAALIVSLFLPWYERGSASMTAWESLSVTDGLLCAIGAVAVSAWVVTATQKTVPVSIAIEAITAVLGLVAVVLALNRVIDMPDPGPGYSTAAGAWIALAAAVGVTGGALMAMRDERLSPAERPTDATGMPIPERVEIEPLPPPEGKPS